MKKLKLESENDVCLDIISEILSRLDSTTLSRFKCVSRSWRDLISDPLFVELLRQRSTKNTKLVHTLESYYTDYRPLSLHSITGGHRRSEKLPTLSSTHGGTGISGSFLVAHDLVCFRGLFTDHQKHLVYVCNPSTGELCALPKTSANTNYSSLGFGYSSRVNGYKVVNTFRCTDQCEVLGFSDRAKIDSSSSWKLLKCPRKFLFHGESISANGKIYWLIWHDKLINNATDQELIISFDIATDTFSTLPPPPSWTLPLRKYNNRVVLMVMDGMLCITNKRNMQKKKGVLDVWMLEGNRVWTMIYSINLLGFRHIHNNLLLHPECMFGDEIVFEAGTHSRKDRVRRKNPRYSYNIKSKTLQMIQSSSQKWHCAGVVWESSFKFSSDSLCQS